MNEINFLLHFVKLKSLNLLFAIELENFSECLNVCLGHLQGFEFGKLPVVPQVRDVFTETFEGVVEAVHAFPLPGVGGQTPFLFHFRQERPFSKLPLRRPGRLGRVSSVGQVQVEVVVVLLGFEVEVTREAGVTVVAAAAAQAVGGREGGVGRGGGSGGGGGQGEGGRGGGRGLQGG